MKKKEFKSLPRICSIERENFDQEQRHELFPVLLIQA